ncbi:hypothetical protein MED121_10020 [Marinomonas sp. MED121]|nr:hypothetical protein MED121_10020 [Marinomonas sp. MED121]
MPSKLGTDTHPISKKVTPVIAIKRENVEKDIRVRLLQ